MGRLRSDHQSNRNNRSSRRSLITKIIILGCLLYSINSLYEWNRSFIRRQKEAPLDHLLSVWQQPLYAFSCPDIPVIDYENDHLLLSPIIMISARPPEQVQPILDSWQQGGMNVTLFSTKKVSEDYTNTKCQQYTWASRLFAVYQLVFDRTLSQYPSSAHFVLLEDDVLLLDPKGLRAEVHWAVRQNLDYYSLFATDESKKACVYNYGAVAQVMSRSMMERLLSVDTDRFCRLPIDMYIAQQGPWYVTRRSLVKHVGKRLKSIPTKKTSAKSP